MAATYPIYFSEQSSNGRSLTPYSAPNPAETSRTLLHSFRNRWPLAAGAGLMLALIGAAAAWWLIPAKYTALALLRVSSWEPALLDDRHNAPPTEKLTYQKTQAALVTSGPVLQSALKNDKVKELGKENARSMAAGWLQEQLYVGFKEDTDILMVALSSADAKEATVLVNAVVDAYMDEVAREERNQQTDRLDDLQKIYLKTQDSLRREKETLKVLAERLKTSDSTALTIKQKNALEEYGLLKKELFRLQSELRSAELKLKLQQIEITPEGKPDVPASMIDELVEADPVIQAELLQLRQVERNYETTKNVSQPGTVALARAELKVKQAKEALEDVRRSRRPVVLKRFADKFGQETKVSLRKTEQQVAALKDQVKEMLEEEGKQKQEVESIGKNSFELEAKRAEIAQQEQVLGALRAEKDRLEIETQSTKRRILPIQRAELPEEKSYTAKTQGAAVAGFCGFLLGAWGVSLRENRQRRIRSVQEINELGMKVVGTLPNLPNRHRLTAPQTQNLPGPYWGNLLGESITYLRTRLLHENKDNSKQLLMIASAMPEEGKTMVAGHLAISIAQSGKRTLIVDGDLRRPILGSLFQAPASRGFCEVLRGEAIVDDVIFPTPVDGLFLLPAGCCSNEVLQALSQENLREIFAKLRSEFDFIIVDSCPLLPVSDGLLLGRLMDAVVLCIRPGVSETPSVLAAYERLRGLNIPVEGVVINGERTTFKSAGYLRYLGSDKAAAG